MLTSFCRQIVWPQKGDVSGLAAMRKGRDSGTVKLKLESKIKLTNGVLGMMKSISDWLGCFRAVRKWAVL